MSDSKGVFSKLAPSRLGKELVYFLKECIFYCPGRTGYFLRSLLVKSIFRESGDDISLGLGIDVTGGENIKMGSRINIMRFSCLHAHDGAIEMGSDVSMNANALISAADGGKVVLGDNVMIGPNVVLRASDHVFNDTKIPMREQGHVGGNIILGDDVWVGANVVITRNVSIGAHSIIGAGSVITRDVASYSIVGGVPGKTLRSRRDAS